MLEGPPDMTPGIQPVNISPMKTNELILFVNE
jgi:hypothetical protein